GDPTNSASLAGVLDGLLQKAAAVGITVFLPIGDWGADDMYPDGKCHVAFPNSDPWVTSCGGTVIGNVSSTTPPTFDERVWSDAQDFTSPFGPNPFTPSDFGATGGGVSDAFPTPAYQSSAGLSPTSKNDNGVRRGLPDIAGMVALTGFLMNGAPYSFTGTSCVAPLYAGLAAVLNAGLGQNIGFLNPTLYAHANEICNDVTQGNNDSGDTPAAPYYSATTGWDACTGWGSLDGSKLLTLLKDTIGTQYLWPEIVITEAMINPLAYLSPQLFIKLNLPDPGPIELLLPQLRAQLERMTPQQKHELHNHLQAIRQYATVLEEEIRATE